MANYIKYNYQFRPIRFKDGELDFSVTEEEAEKAMAEKQTILSNVLQRESIPCKSKNTDFGNRICYARNGKFIIHIASNHVFRRARNFAKQAMSHNPWNTIIIDNRKDIQCIYIENVPDSFKDPNTLSEMLESALNILLYDYNLKLSLKPVFHTDDFWEFVEKHRNEISWFEFTYNYPNLPQVSASSEFTVKNICKATNTGCKYHFFADTDQSAIVSKGLSENLELMVEAASSSGNAIRIKLKGKRQAVDIGCQKYTMLTFPNDITERSCQYTLFDDDELDTLTILLDSYCND